MLIFSPDIPLCNWDEVGAQAYFGPQSIICSLENVFVVRDLKPYQQSVDSVDCGRTSVKLSLSRSLKLRCATDQSQVHLEPHLPAHEGCPLLLFIFNIIYIYYYLYSE